ncbi:hypothetical protein EDB92DRAFT_1829327 [Lactarius akahatsu]|uniref:Actin cytoskeleton-regulatory complex protein SLA1 n=1 Tax=Lactarius akahatsu TaxID=416441 RepID=A0AAD4QF12_9AGAM|nr:hypothetical protein EDB92DRAFT_1829327 [Lactarius akahatsu]
MSDEQYLAVLKASYDYVPQSGDEIGIKEDQLLLLVEKTDDDWWKVKVKGDDQSGLVPSAYVESAEHSSIVKAQYDYAAVAEGELSVKEDQLLLVFGPEEDGWLLVQDKDDGKVGYVPGNYIEAVDDASPTAAVPSVTPNIVVPDSPPRRARPVSTYVDPAELVRSTASKVKADAIKTWSVSEIDKKGKKKKGTLGVGNGAIFFASEADKTPVQKWQIGDITSADIDKSKHILIEVGGSAAASLHFHAGNKDTAEEILAKLESSRNLARESIEAPAASAAATKHQAEPEPEPEPAQAPVQRTLPPPLLSNGSNSPGKKGVHFSEASPAIIPPRPASPPEPEREEAEGLEAAALYDFQAQGDDELTVAEGDALWIIEQEGDEWWKCRNIKGDEGVVPASYIEPTGAGRLPVRSAEPEDDEDDGVAEREAEERAVAERAEQEAREAREHKERQAQEQRAKAAAAEAERKRKEKERREREEHAKREKEREDEEAAEEARRVADDKREAKSAPKTVRSPKPEGRKSVEKRPPPDPSQTREWRDRTGQFRVEAAFLGYKNGVLRLHKVNGVVIEVPSEKMSAEDMRYVEKINGRGGSVSRKSGDDDDEPLAKRRQSLHTVPAPTKKVPPTDWFEFFLNAGCDVDDCTRYASSFERDKIDEAILPDITEGTLRTLGLREGDIIRVAKVIEARRPKPPAKAASSEVNLLGSDEAGGPARATPSPGPPNLFTGPGGQLKNARRGRPTPSKTSSTAPGAVDLTAISTASEQIARTSTPLVTSPTGTPALAASPSQVPPSRSNSAAPSGFDDDAWTNRPSSTKPVAPTPPIPERAPSVPPIPGAFASATAPTSSQPPRAPSAPATQLAPSSASTGGLAKTDADIFDQLARLSQLRVQTPAAAAPPAPSPGIASPPAMAAMSGYNPGLGASHAPPLGPHPTLSLPLQGQSTGLLSPSGARGPFAPVPANQGLLAPLVPTTTGFTGFVPTRPATSPSFLGTQPTGFQPSLAPQPTGFQPSLAPQPTGFQSNLAPQQTGFQPNLAPQQTGFQPNLAPQPTGFQPSLALQPTGFGVGSPFGAGQLGGVPPVPPLPASFQNGSFGQLQPQPTGFNPGFGQPSYGSAAPPLPGGSAPKDTNPANVFAAMKAGTFANDSAPQSADKYAALRVDPSPSPLSAQPTGWGFPGFPGGYPGFQR